MISRKLKDLGALVVGRVGDIAVGFLLTPIAARTMPQEEFGVWAIAMALNSFAGIFASGGIPFYVIREAKLGHEKLQVALACAFLLSTLVATAGALASLPVALVLDMRPWTLVFASMMLGLPTSSVAGVLFGLLRREKRFGVTTGVEFGLNSLHFIVAASLLTFGYGVWGYVISSLVKHVVALPTLMLITKTVPRFGFDTVIANEIVVYTRGLIGYQSVNFWARNADSLLIGKVLGTVALGQYSVAYRLMLLPLTHVFQLFQSLLLPYLSPYQDNPKALFQHLSTTVQAMGILTIPPMTLLWLNSHWFLDFYLGPGWDESARLLAVLAPVGMYQITISPLGVLYQVRGLNDKLFKLAMFNSLITVFGFAVSVGFGLRAVVVTYAVVNALLCIPNLSLAMKTVGCKGSDWFFAMLPLSLIPVLSLTFHYVYIKVVDARSVLVFDSFAVASVATLIAVVFYRSMLIRAFATIAPRWKGFASV